MGTHPDFQRLFETFQESAWRWECQGVYREPDEREPLRRFLAGEPPDDAWMAPFLDLVRGATAAGKRFERVRMMTRPLTDYLRFEMDIARRCNVPAGEDIRILWPDEAERLGAPPVDFWLFDDHTAAVMSFDDGGVSAVDLVTGDAAEPYRQWKRRAWEYSHPLEDYAATS